MRHFLSTALFCAIWFHGWPLWGDVPITNPSFEQGDQTPDGWVLSGGEGCFIRPGADGRRAICVKGNGTASNGWLSEPLPLESNSVYRLQFQARRLLGTSGLPTSGPSFCNRDLPSLYDSWTQFESFFVSPRHLTPEQCRLRFGQWEVAGELAFDDIRIGRVIPIYRRANGIELGEGEAIHGNQYSFKAPFTQQSANHARTLAWHSCSFNTHRWVFGGPSQEVVYRHSIGRRQRNAMVSAQVGWHQRGQLIVAASVNGQEWQQIGTIDRLNSKSFAVPQAMLPANEIWVRLSVKPTSDGAPGPALQVYGYGYTAELDGAPIDLSGTTQFVTIHQEDPKLNVSIDRLGGAIPGLDNRVILRLQNQTDHPLRLRAMAYLDPVECQVNDRRTPSVSTEVRAQDVLLQPGETGKQTIEIPFLSADVGTQRLCIKIAGDASYSAETTCIVPALYASHYGKVLPGSTADVGLWYCSSGWKVSAVRPIPGAHGDAMLIEAAANEAEALQLVVRPSRSVAQFTAKVSDLLDDRGNHIRSGRIDILRVGYVHVTQSTDATGAIGLWPDPLPPFDKPCDLVAERNHPLWIRVRVPEGTPSGLYRGEIQLRAEGYRVDVPLHVRVFGFELPDRMTCQTAFGFDPSLVSRYHGLQTPTQKREVLEKYLKCLSDHHISPYDPAPMDSIEVTWDLAPRGGLESSEQPIPKPVFDFTAWDRAMTRAIDRHHFNTFRLRVPGLGSGTFHQRYEPTLQGYAEKTVQYQEAMKSYLQQLETHLQEKGWLDEAFVYWFDEPDPKDYEFVLNGFSKLKRWAPRLRRMLTEQVEPGLMGGPNIWCPLTPSFDRDLADQHRQLGEQFWWYVCTGPKAPYCTLFIDHPATEMRVWLWQTWQRRIRGILVWQTNYWTSSAAYPDAAKPQNPYLDPMGWVSGYSTEKGARRAWGNGDGRFLYPPEAAADGRPEKPVLDHPVSSIRLEMLRDGIEDYEYFVILERLIKSNQPQLTKSEAANYEALLHVPSDVTEDLTHFTQTPGPIAKRRKEIARAIEQLNDE